MKTESNMLSKAMEIANSDSNARVCFFFKDYQSSFSVRKTILDNMSLYKGATWKSQACEYKAEGGGVLKVLYCKPENATDLGGCIFTHIFYVAQSFNSEYKVVLDFLKSRIRSSKYKGEAPMGMYNEWYAEICVPY